MSAETNVEQAQVKSVEAPLPADAQVVAVPVRESEPKVLVQVPTIHDLPAGTVIAPGITVA